MSFKFFDNFLLFWPFHVSRAGYSICILSNRHLQYLQKWSLIEATIMSFLVVSLRQKLWAVVRRGFLRKFSHFFSTWCQWKVIIDNLMWFQVVVVEGLNASNCQSFCSDPTCGGRNYILKWVFFFCSVNFGRSIYSS